MDGRILHRWDLPTNLCMKESGTMRNDTTHEDRLRQRPTPKGLGEILQTKDEESEVEENSSSRAFGFLRGSRDQSAAVEFRFKSGNSISFPYNWLGTWKYDPSEGILIKFSGDLVYLVLLKGSNLDKPLKGGAVTLMRAGFQRHRLMWVREMSEADIRNAEPTEPIIDSIEIEEFESHAALKEWLAKKAPAFLT